MNETYEHRCRLLLRVYPPRYRQTREDELLATLLDAAEPDSERPPLGDCWDVIRGGLLFRLRDRPPLHRWLAYRYFDKRVPFRYRWWVRDDVVGRFHYMRMQIANAIFILALFPLGAAISFAVGGQGLAYFILQRGLPSAGIGFLVGIFLPAIKRNLREKHRKGIYKVLAKHEFNPDGTPYQYPAAQALWQNPSPHSMPAPSVTEHPPASE